MKKILVTLISLFVFIAMIHAANAKTLRFATEATYPPFEYTDASGKIKGFDIDVAKALCKQMNAQCTFSSQSFNSLIPSLVLGKYDALIASLGVTPERLQRVDFTNAYYEPSASFVDSLDKHYSVNNLEGRIVGVQQGSTFESYLHDKYGDKITIKTYASVQDAFSDLTAGRVDVVIADTPIAMEWLKNNSKQYGIIDKPIVDHQYFGTGFGIAVSKKNPELLKALNKAISEIKANGIYNSIYDRYFKS